jgi:hypothetical protein
MKKYALIALALIGLGSNKLMAQSESGMYGGVNFMPTLTSFEVRGIDNGVAKGEFAIGYGFGAQLGYNFNKHIATQLEVIYSTLSQRYTDAAAERTVNLSYLHFPLLFRVNSDITRPVNFNVVLGPQFGINIGADVDADGGAVADTVEAVLAVKPADFGVAYGAGLNFGLGPNANPKINLGFRGVYGLLDISDRSQTTATDQYYILDRSHVKTYAAVLGLTFLF